ncbi:Mediator of RNA polymerase II transcription subunit 33B [Spatholobus suberectus]|nr:Mediator of RNA polymerase II transcription subunit 33B [Spatholobus suberectus]
MELLKQLGFMLEHDIDSPNYEKIMKSIDDVLQLSQVYSQKVWEPGVVLVEFVFSVVWQLLEASVDDEGLLDHTIENKPRWLSRSHDMNIDGSLDDEKKTEHAEGFQKKNTAMAIEIIAEFLQHKMTSRILSLIHWIICLLLVNLMVIVGLHSGFLLILSWKMLWMDGKWQHLVLLKLLLV